MSKRVLIVTDRIGRDNAELGRVLMRSFCYSLARTEPMPVSVYLLNDGVRLACAGSEVLDDLRILIENGVQVRACGTCLDFLELTSSLEVGEIGMMPDTVAGLMSGSNVVTVA
jgi:selenium metabolism protein YedF